MLHTVVIDVAAGQPDKAEAERRAKLAVGYANGTVSDTREVRDQAGKLIRYEVDIR